ncbi:flagellar hook-basal body complex protein [Clostridium vincentii]|uniref:Flagellar basal-body rod protein FlgG n=1 Tax=Clostridium vincentii TaxID=52704 RepID=A0A2T0BJB7_9CLOT|nr:flagellar hook-basal body complex protein [Clostridium vincentii]PRR83959.1 Flagellar basal-body rod protein FlgG [Clostridium vincentii]
MIRSLYTAVSGMITMENKQNTVTNNMANANTTGYKSQNLVTKSFNDVLLQNMDKVTNGVNQKQELGTISLGVAIDAVNTNFTQGTLKETGKVGDLAIEGKGFFAVKSGDQTFYTRDGQFRVNNQGNLANNSGDLLLGTNKATGALEPITVASGDFTVDKYNNVYVNGTATHKIAIADFADYATLGKTGDNYYTGENPTYAGDARVSQGFLETSNVNITNEMVDMMTVMRNFESAQKFVTMLDESLGKAANEVGKV